MTRFTMTEVGNKSGEVMEAAFRGPVEVTSRGKRKFIIMTAEDFDRLAGSTRRAVHVDDLSDDEASQMIEALSEDRDP